jgi:hypothetical protein
MQLRETESFSVFDNHRRAFGVHADFDPDCGYEDPQSHGQSDPSLVLSVRLHFAVGNPQSGNTLSRRYSYLCVASQIHLLGFLDSG